jgi:hypothetical protein
MVSNTKSLHLTMDKATKQLRINVAIGAILRQTSVLIPYILIWEMDLNLRIIGYKFLMSQLRN